MLSPTTNGVLMAVAALYFTAAIQYPNLRWGWGRGGRRVRVGPLATAGFALVFWSFALITLLPDAWKSPLLLLGAPVGVVMVFVGSAQDRRRPL